MTWRWPLLMTPKAMPTNPANMFGAVRKHHIHEGVDIASWSPDAVFAVEPGVVRRIDWFTGPQAGSPWWLPTKAVMVEGPTGLVVYGEISPRPELGIGVEVREGTCLGVTTRVLRKDKGLPTTMLHLELRAPGHTENFDWQLGTPKPDWLLDPTPHLIAAKETHAPVHAKP